MALEVHAPGLVLVEHEFDVPLDHAAPDGETITVFAREVADPEGRDRPLLVYLQGGPGQEAPRPTRGPSAPGWLDRALADYRVLMLDQRGTGRSSPVAAELTGSAEETADRLASYRADAIVADAELVRERLGVDRWSILGQSFGGFCALRYLSVAADSLREAFFTGGLPPVDRDVDDVYRATYARMLERNRRYYRRYPGDRERVRAVLDLLAEGAVTVRGSTMTPRWFRQVGNVLGMSDGAERLHYLLERDPRSPAFAWDLAAMLPFNARNPLYAVIHEASYADGRPTRWSAERVMPDELREDPSLFTGEHVFPWNFEDDHELAPLAEPAELLAARAWPTLYDAAALASCEVPCAAAVYAEDVYVEREFSEETAAMLPRMRTWVTNEYEHNGLRAAGDHVLDRLIGMARGTVP